MRFPLRSTFTRIAFPGLLVAILLTLQAMNAAAASDLRAAPLSPEVGEAGSTGASSRLTRQISGPFAGIDIYFHDTEGKAGISFAPDETGFRGRIGIEDGTIYTSEDDGSPGVILKAYGTPYWWETTNPWSGTVRGWAKAVPYDEQPQLPLPRPGQRGRILHFQARGESAG
jgi:hypothetical protein